MIKEKNNTPHILKIEQWDGKLPTGDWVGPEALPLYPNAEFNESHIHYYPNKEQHIKIKDWVNDNIPDYIKRHIHGLDFFHPQLQQIFFALPSIYILETEQSSDFKDNNPEIYKDDWDENLDTYRQKFIDFLKEIKCLFHFMTENEALDNGMLEMKSYTKPNIIGSQDMYPGLSTPPKKLWRYFTYKKFVKMFQDNSIWFSRPQHFDDIHEFTMDESSQQELFQWKLDSFAREYNRAITSNKESFLETSTPLIVGLPIGIDGKIEKKSINFSNLSDSLLSSIKKDIQVWQESFCISCWRYSPHDSISIWNQYATLEEGIAIVVDLEGIRKSFQQYVDARLAVIEYRDFSDTLNTAMIMNPLTYKDIRFESEAEARFYFRAKLGDEKGISIPFNTSEVIKEIHLSPNASDDFKNTIQDLLDENNITTTLTKSPLNEVPNKF